MKLTEAMMLNSCHSFNNLAEFLYCRGIPRRNGNTQSHDEQDNRELFPSLSFPVIPQIEEFIGFSKVATFPEIYINIFSHNKKNIVEVEL